MRGNGVSWPQTLSTGASRFKKQFDWNEETKIVIRIIGYVIEKIGSG